MVRVTGFESGTPKQQHFVLPQCRYHNDANSKQIKTLKIVSLNPTDPSKIKHPKKCDTKTLTPESRQAKTHWQKLFLTQFLSISPKLFICLKCSLDGDVTQNFFRLHQILCWRKVY